MRLLALTMTLAMTVMPAASQTTAQKPAFKTFTNRAGWSIQYPANWKVGSCHSCLDPAEGSVFVTFRNPDRPENFVMIEHLASKPAGETVEHWLEKMSQNPNPRMSQERLLIDGMPALKVRSRSSVGRAFETVFIIRNSDTFSIEIVDDKAGERIQAMSIYPIYQHMLSTFKFTRK